MQGSTACKPVQHAALQQAKCITGVFVALAAHKPVWYRAHAAVPAPCIASAGEQRSYMLLSRHRSVLPSSTRYYGQHDSMLCPKAGGIELIRPVTKTNK